MSTGTDAEVVRPVPAPRHAVLRGGLLGRSGRGDLVLGSLSSLVLAGTAMFICAAALTPAEFAGLTAAVIITSVVPLALAWGQPDALVLGWLGRRPHGIVSTAGIVSGGLSCLAVGTTLVAGALLGLPLGVTAPAAAATGGWIVFGFLQAVEQSHGRYRALAKLAALPGALVLLGLCVLLVTDSMSLSNVLWVRAVAVLAVVVFRIATSRRRLRDGRPSLQVAVDMLRTGTLIHVTALLAVAGTRLDQVFALHYFDTATLAAYGMVLPVCAAVRGVVLAAGSVSFVEVARAAGAAARRLPRELRNAALTSLGAAGLGAVLLVAVDRIILPGKFDLPVGAAALILIGSAVVALAEQAIRLLRASGSVSSGIYGRVAMLVAMAFLGPMLIPTGLLGTGVVTCAVGVVGLGILLNAMWSRAKGAHDVEAT